MSFRLPPHHVPRPRLVARLAPARLVVVEAGAGYGKTTLALEAGAELGVGFATVALEPPDTDPGMLAVRVGRALRRAGLSDLAAPLGEFRDDPEEAVEALADALAARSDPVVIVLDDVHHADGPAGGLVRRLVRAVGFPHRVWLLGRRLPDTADAAADVPEVLRLDSSDLAFTREEAVALCRAVLGGDGPADALLRTTGGWVAALVLGALASARGDDTADALRGDAGDALGDLVRRALGRLDAADREAFLRAARLPRLSPQVADAATGRPGLLERASAAGLPLARG
ncbi:MAG: AAA family ATPase, partial [Actinomycetota bacterium]